MKLSFYARGDALVTVPGVQPQIGQSLPRVGRTNVHTPAEVLDEYHAKAGVKPGFLVPPATREPYSVDSESPAGQRLKKLIRREPCLWAADEETAAECGVPFVLVDFVDGAWVPAKFAEIDFHTGKVSVASAPEAEASEPEGAE